MCRGSNIKISNALKISPRLRAVPLGLNTKESVLLLIFQFFFHQRGMARAGPKKVIGESLPATAPSAHSGFSKGSPCLHVMIIII